MSSKKFEKKIVIMIKFNFRSVLYMNIEMDI